MPANIGEPAKGIVLDANILIRAVLGKRVGSLLEAYSNSVAFYAPEVCFADAREYLPHILSKSREDPETGLVALDQIGLLVQTVEESLYLPFEEPARERISVRDVDDWPVVAVALLLRIPVWTEDRDFFGSGIPTWTTDSPTSVGVERFFG